MEVFNQGDMDIQGMGHSSNREIIYLLNVNTFGSANRMSA
jgi:hypothetical protein